MILQQSLGDSFVDFDMISYGYWRGFSCYDFQSTSKRDIFKGAQQMPDA